MIGQLPCLRPFIPLKLEPVASQACPGQGKLQRPLVHSPKITLWRCLRQGIDRRAGEFQELCLPNNGSVVRFVDHRFALAAPIRPSAPAKKSISSTGWPIFTRDSFRSSVAACFSAAVVKTPEAFSHKGVFHGGSDSDERPISRLTWLASHRL
jgi:hypothetical protein